MSKIIMSLCALSVFALVHGSDVFVPGKKGITKHQRMVLKGFVDSIYEGNSESLNALLDAHTNLRDFELENKLPLCVAVDAGKIESLKALLAHGADPKIVNRSQETLLHTIYKPFSVSKRKVGRNNAFNFSAAELLLEQGDISVNARDKKGNTALHYAVLHSDLSSVRLLLSRGADAATSNHSGLSPLTLAHLVLCPKFNVAQFSEIEEFAKDASVLDVDKSEVYRILESSVTPDTLAESVRVVTEAQAAAEAAQATEDGVAVSTATDDAAATEKAVPATGFMAAIIKFFTFGKK